jgi:hypothetical protein
MPEVFSSTLDHLLKGTQGYSIVQHIKPTPQYEIIVIDPNSVINNPLLPQKSEISNSDAIRWTSCDQNMMSSCVVFVLKNGGIIYTNWSLPTIYTEIGSMYSLVNSGAIFSYGG